MTNPTAADLMTFRTWEQDWWQRAATGYHQFWGKPSLQVTGSSLDAVGANAGIRILDDASGPGYAAEAAGERGASVIGIDYAEAMVAQARRNFPVVEFQQAMPRH